MRTLADRFWMKVRKQSGRRCWEWTAYRNKKGYGQIARGPAGSGMCLAHRVSWEINRGPIPEGLNVLHECDNPCCVRPDHLFLGTLADNNADMAAKGRAQRYRGESDHCPNGHAYAGNERKRSDGYRQCVTCARTRGVRSERRRAREKREAKLHAPA